MLQTYEALVEECVDFWCVTLCVCSNFGDCAAFSKACFLAELRDILKCDFSFLLHHILPFAR
jgi:hypothetical protein